MAETSRQLRNRRAMMTPRVGASTERRRDAGRRASNGCYTSRLLQVLAKQSVAWAKGAEENGKSHLLDRILCSKRGWRVHPPWRRTVQGVLVSVHTRDTHTHAHASTHTRARAHRHILRPRSLVPRRPSRWPFFCWSGETRPAIEEPRDCTVTRSVSTHEPARGGRPVECSALLSTCRRSWPPATRGPGPCMCAWHA